MLILLRVSSLGRSWGQLPWHEEGTANLSGLVWEPENRRRLKELNSPSILAPSISSGFLAPKLALAELNQLPLVGQNPDVQPR